MRRSTTFRTSPALGRLEGTDGSTREEGGKRTRPASRSFARGIWQIVVHLCYITP